MKTYEYTVLFEPAPAGDYNVVVPAIPEIYTFGNTIGKAREMAADAIRCFLESAQITGEPIPQGDESPTEHGESLTEHLAVTI